MCEGYGIDFERQSFQLLDSLLQDISRKAQLLLFVLQGDQRELPNTFIFALGSLDVHRALTVITMLVVQEHFNNSFPKNSNYQFSNFEGFGN